MLSGRLALQATQQDQRPRCVNVAPASLNDGSFIARARELAAREARLKQRFALMLAVTVAFLLIAAYLLLWRTRRGFELRAVGLSPGAANA